jgi:hypothetical protein
MEGHVKCTKEDDFLAFIAILEKGYWLKDDHLQDESETNISDERNVDRATMTIYFPRFCYRNLVRVELFPKGAGREGFIVGVCTDGMGVCWVEGPDGSVEEKLEDYVDEDETLPDPDADPEEWWALMDDAGDHFFDVKLSSIKLPG